MRVFSACLSEKTFLCLSIQNTLEALKLIGGVDSSISVSYK
jgi:hypothetical protein